MFCAKLIIKSGSDQRISKQNNESDQISTTSFQYSEQQTRLVWYQKSVRYQVLDMTRGEEHVNLIFTPSFPPQWVPEISHHCPRTPFLLVGTQVDLREDSNTIEKLAKNKQRPLYPESGEKLARELKAVKYVECSALTQVHPTVKLKAS